MKKIVLALPVLLMLGCSANKNNAISASWLTVPAENIIDKIEEGMTKEQVRALTGKADVVEDCKFNDRSICHQWVFKGARCWKITRRDPSAPTSGAIGGDCTVRFNDETELVDGWNKNTQLYTLKELVPL